MKNMKYKPKNKKHTFLKIFFSDTWKLILPIPRKYILIPLMSGAYVPDFMQTLL